jgi:pilus assembly protein CpaB
MSRSKTVLGVALVLGLLAALAGYAGLNAMAKQVVASTSKQFVPVVVSATDLTFGTKLDKAQLRVARYPKESVPAGAFSDVDSVAGQTTKIFLAAREPVTATKLSSRGGGLSMLVRNGLRATSLEVNQVSGVSGFVLPGDRVDVLCTVDGRGAKEVAVTRTILQNAEVLASGQRTTQQDNKPITVQAVTILVDPVGAEKLALGLHEGKLHLVLRNPGDADTLRVASLDTHEMLGGEPTRMASAPVKRSSGKRAKAEPKEPPQPPPANTMVQTRTGKPTVRIIRDSKVTEVPALKDSLQ